MNWWNASVTPRKSWESQDENVAQETLNTLEEQVENILTETAQMLWLDMDESFVLSKLRLSFSSHSDVSRVIDSIERDHPSVKISKNSDAYTHLSDAFNLYKSLSMQILELTANEFWDEINNTIWDDGMFSGRSHEGANWFT